MDKLKGFISRHKKLLVVLVLVVVVGLIGFKFFGPKQASVQTQTVTVERGTIVSGVSASGAVLSANFTPINTKASGTVAAVYVKDGDTVTSGQKIAEVTLSAEGQQANASAWANYQNAVSNLASANATAYSLKSAMLSSWDDFKSLAESGAYTNGDGSANSGNRAAPEFATAEADWQAAEAKYKNQQTAIAAAQSSLNSSYLTYQQTSGTVVAAAAGEIDSVTVAPGMVINSVASTSTTDTGSTQRVAIIKNTNEPIVSANVSEVDVQKVKAGQKATVTLDSIADKTFTGKVVSVDRIGETSSNVTNYPVLIQLDTGSDSLLPNMAASANIILSTKADVLVVPTGAVQTQNGTSTVRVQRGGKEIQVEVKTGLVGDTQTEITSGLKEGDVVITGTTTTGTGSTTRSVFSGNSSFGGGSFGGGTRINRQ